MTRFALVLSLALALAGAASADDTERRLTSGALERSYLLHLPPLARSGESLPLVLVLHGAGSNAWGVRAQTGFADEADWRGFAVAFPNGTSGERPLLGASPSLTWNAGECCGWASEQRIDDVAFLRAVVDDVAKVVPVDPARVFVAGMSNGGMMAYRLACQASDSFAAIGVVAGALVAPQCGPVETVSVIHVHGNADEVVPLAGGRGRPVPPGFYPSAASAFDFWRAANGCDSAAVARIPYPGRRVTRALGCPEDGAVELWELDGGRHGWPGGSHSLLVPGRLSATPLLADFFATHPRR